jgi:hypothetical protein
MPSCLRRMAASLAWSNWANRGMPYRLAATSDKLAGGSGDHWASGWKYGPSWGGTSTLTPYAAAGAVGLGANARLRGWKWREATAGSAAKACPDAVRCRTPTAGLAPARPPVGRCANAAATPRRRGSKRRTTGTPSPGPDIGLKTVKAIAYMKRTPTRPMATVPYSFGEAAS